MKIVNGYKEIEKGDAIYCKGKPIIVDFITDQFDAGKEGMFCEFYDVCGIHRSWKQWSDGGHLIGYQDYKLIDYYDVYCQNNSYVVMGEMEVNKLITLKNDCSDKEIVEYLTAIDYLNSDKEELYYFEEIDNSIIIKARDNKRPLGRLERIE